jgi:hypothetical protein
MNPLFLLLRRALFLVILLSLTAPVAADDFPRDLVAWQPQTTEPVFHGTGGKDWDRMIRERGWILIEDGIFHLWYTGYNNDRSSTKLLGHATSNDGIHWRRDARNPLLPDDWVEDMCVIHHNGEYSMFAEGRNDVMHLLISRDGIHWTEHGPLDIRQTNGEPIRPGPYGTPAVWVEGDTWFLLYERGDEGIWLAKTKRRLLWQNVQDEPVLKRGPEPYDREAVAVNQVIKRGDYYYAFYHAAATRPWKDWTTNVARSKDLVHWEKYPGNPIIQNNCSSAILVSTPRGDRLYTMHPSVRVFVPESNTKPNDAKPRQEAEPAKVGAGAR